MKEGLLELKRSSKARENSWPARFRSQRRLLWKWHFTAKLFCSENSPLRNRHLAVKSFCSPKKPLRKRHYAAKSFCTPMPPLVKIFTAAKPPLGTRVPFRSTVTPFHSCKMAAKSPKREISNFRNQSPISQGVSQLRNTPLAHECHFEA